MTEHTSELGEKIILTEDQLVELKLTQKPWVITSVWSGLYLTAAIAEIYRTTNLFELIQKYHILSEISPRVRIILKPISGDDDNNNVKTVELIPKEVYMIYNSLFQRNKNV